MIVEAIGLGVSLFGASQNNKAAQKAMNAQAAADTVARRATADSMIASVTSANKKADELQRAQDIMVMQGKADSVIRTENYNEAAAMQMVMGAASGRTFGEGSIDAIMSKSHEDFMWDQIWHTNSEEISKAAIQQDKASIYEAGAQSLILGRNQLEVARQSSMAGTQNTAAAAEQAFTNTLTRGVTNVMTSFGDSGIKNLLGV